MSNPDQVAEDPFLRFAGTRVLKAEPEEGVAEQGHDPELLNHAGARHAGALFTVGQAASRAMVEAALADKRVTGEPRMEDSQTAFEKVVTEGKVIATAGPASSDWQALLRRASEGERVSLPTLVQVRDDAGRTVTTMEVSWSVGSLTDGQ